MTDITALLASVAPGAIRAPAAIAAAPDFSLLIGDITLQPPIVAGSRQPVADAGKVLPVTASPTPAFPDAVIARMIADPAALDVVPVAESSDPPPLPAIRAETDRSSTPIRLLPATPEDVATPTPPIKPIVTPAFAVRTRDGGTPANTASHPGNTPRNRVAPVDSAAFEPAPSLVAVYTLSEVSAHPVIEARSREHIADGRFNDVAVPSATEPPLPIVPPDHAPAFIITAPVELPPPPAPAIAATMPVVVAAPVIVATAAPIADMLPDDPRPTPPQAGEVEVPASSPSQPVDPAINPVRPPDGTVATQPTSATAQIGDLTPVESRQLETKPTFIMPIAPASRGNAWFEQPPPQRVIPQIMVQGTPPTVAMPDLKTIVTGRSDVAAARSAMPRRDAPAARGTPAALMAASAPVAQATSSAASVQGTIDAPVVAANEATLPVSAPLGITPRQPKEDVRQPAAKVAELLWQQAVGAERIRAWQPHPVPQPQAQPRPTQVTSHADSAVLTTLPATRAIEPSIDGVVAALQPPASLAVAHPPVVDPGANATLRSAEPHHAVASQPISASSIAAVATTAMPPSGASPMGHPPASPSPLPPIAAIPLRRTGSTQQADNPTSPETGAIRPAAPTTPHTDPVALPAAQVFAGALFAADETLRARPAARANAGELAALASVDATAPAIATSVPASASAPIDTSRAEWIDSMIDRIEMLSATAGGERRETRIRLNPDQLGSVEIAIERDGETTNLRFVAETQATRTLLAEAAPRLAELADARGLKLGHAQVDLGGTATQSHAQPQQQQRHPDTAAAPDRPTRTAAATTDIESARSADPSIHRIA